MASRQVENDERSGIVGLVRETLDGLRTLIADHIKLARIELETDLQSYVRGLGGLALAVAIVAVGYVFAWLALALALARAWGAPAAFGAIAGLHVLVGGVAVGSAVGRMKRTRLMHGSAVEARASVNALARPLQGRTS
ncbi:MAG TPA: phage holin family protein [Polyangia bacterium]|nr:phage holin family protein [Polyangia bacterium]